MNRIFKKGNFLVIVAVLLSLITVLSPLEVKAANGDVIVNSVTVNNNNIVLTIYVEGNYSNSNNDTLRVTYGNTTLATSSNGSYSNQTGYTTYTVSINSNNVRTGDLTVSFSSGNGQQAVSDSISISLYNNITYSVGNGTFNYIDNTNYLYGASITVTNNEPTLAGYEFSGWSTTNGGDVEYAPGATITNLQSDITLYAVYTQIFTVAYNYENGDAVSYEFTEGDEVTILGNDETNEGFIFSGWSVYEGSDVVVYSENDLILSISSNINLYPVWEQITYTATFNYNFSGMEITYETVDYGSVFTNINLSESGYVFSGWYLDGAKYDFETSVYSDITLEAVWLKLHTLTYSFGEESIFNEHIEGSSVQVLANNFVKEGFNFLGWSTTVDGEVLYEPNDYITMDQDVILYPVWEQITFKVSYDFGYDSLEDTETVNYGDLALGKDMDTREGYEFIGWFIDGEEFDFSTEIYENIELTAMWEELYTITYSYEDEEIESNYFEGNMALIAENTFEKLGFEFIGWATDLNGEVVYLASEEIELIENIVLYPVWEQITFDVIFSYNFDDESVLNTVNYGSTISEIILVREGYEFIGWFIDGEEFDFSTEIYENIELTAMWEELYTITYSYEDNEIESNYFEGNMALIAENTFEKIGFEFIGWATDLNGEVIYLASEEIELIENIVLYPVWEQITFKVSYDFGYDSLEDTETVNYGDLALGKDMDTREGYEFIGWFIDGEEFDFSTEIYEDLTLEAVWEEIVEDELGVGSDNEDIVNPQTGSNIVSMSYIFVISLIGISAFTLRKKIFNK